MLKIGHRGAKAYAPENTIASFKKALELGVDMVEFDIRLTKDRHPVVVHNIQLARLAKKAKRISHVTLAELKNFRIKGKAEIPTLAEVLETIDNKIGMDIDIKVKGAAQIVVQTLRDHGVDFNNVMISSNYPGELNMAEQMEPQITTALIFRSAFHYFSFWLLMDFFAVLFLPVTKYYISWLVKRANADYLVINHHLLNRKKVECFKNNGIKICAWTVNNVKKINYLKSLGVDGIITNYPDRL